MKILVIAEQKDGVVDGSTYEALGAATALGGELHTAILAADAGPLAQELAARGAGKVLALSHSKLSSFNQEIYRAALGELIAKYQPNVVIAPGRMTSKSLLSALAATTGGGMATDAIALRADGADVIVTRSQYNGKALTEVKASDPSKPFFITTRLKAFDAVAPGAGEVIEESVSDSCFESKTEVVESVTEGEQTVKLEDADVVVSFGRGLQGAENIPMVQALADSLGAALGASRAVVDAGWIEYKHQVGQTGRSVSPKLYVTVGISGAIQHLVGMQTSKVIVAINKDKDAPIFNVATYGIAGDAFEIVPALTKRFQQGG